jgi:DNA-binding response OmpR family regulator
MNICILEDEESLADWIAKKLEKEGYNVIVFYNLKQFIDWLNWPSDLYIIDIWLPDGSWYDAIEFLRNEKNINSPVIISSWYWDIDNKIHSFNSWVDDYLVKPYKPEELVVRVWALIRRTFAKSPQAVIKYKDFTYDTINKVLKKWKYEIKLSKKEMDLVEYFLYNRWKLITKQKIVSSVWWNFDGFTVSDNTINVTLSRVRTKLWNWFELLTIVWEWYMLKMA